MISAGELRKGLIIELEGQLYSILEYQHLKLGRGSAQVRLRLRNLRTGAISDSTFQAGERFSRVRLDHGSVQYLYSEGDVHHFMDQETFEQLALSSEQLGDATKYLKDGTVLELLLHEGEPVGVDLALTADLVVSQTEPGFKGDTATGGTKPATLETGLVVQVPLFVNAGDTIRVDTRSGTYVTRVS